MIHTVLNREGVALMGLEGMFVHFGGTFRNIEKPHSDEFIRRWCLEVSTGATQLSWDGEKFTLVRLQRTATFSYNYLGLYGLREWLAMDPNYHSRYFESASVGEIVSRTPLPSAY